MMSMTSMPELGGPNIPGSLKRKLLDQLNWQDFIITLQMKKSRFLRTGLFSFVCPMFRRSKWPSFENHGSFYDNDPRTEALSRTQLVSTVKSPVLTLKFSLTLKLAGDGLKVSQIMTLIDPNMTKPCKVLVVLEKN